MKVLQRAVAVLDAVCEQDFKPWSYGFRHGRSAHQALAATRDHLKKMGGGLVLEVDIQDFLDPSEIWTTPTFGTSSSNGCSTACCTA